MASAPAAVRQVACKAPDLEHLNLIRAHTVGDEVVLGHQEFAHVFAGTVPAEQREFAQALDLAEVGDSERFGPVSWA